MGSFPAIYPPAHYYQEKQQRKRKISLLTSMASISISASLHRTCGSHRVTKKQRPQARTARSLGSKQATRAVTLNVEGQRGVGMSEQQEKPALATGGSNKANDKLENGLETKHSVPKFIDERWKKGTWDLNMFVRDGKMDWDGLIEAGEYTILHLKCENHQTFALVSFFMHI
jgi:hypothetical protein